MKVKATPEDDDRAARFVTNGPVRDLIALEFAKIRAEEREACALAIEAYVEARGFYDHARGPFVTAAEIVRGRARGSTA